MLLVGVAKARVPAEVSAPGNGHNHKAVCAPGQVKGQIRAAQCFSSVETDATGTPLVSPTPLATAYGPAQFHTGYNLPKKTPKIPGSRSRKKNTIAIVDAFWIPTIRADLDTFDSAYGLPAFPRCTTATATACIQLYRQDGSLMSTTNHPAEDDGWGLEIDLDVQVAHEICQNCRINVVLANDNFFNNLETAVNEASALGSQEISNSYGAYLYDCSEPGYNHPNKAVVVSSGDSGFGVACPANLNTVVSVGGTTLNLSGTNTYLSEQAWNGTGGGCSTTQAAQPWQTSLPNWGATGCGSGRAMNDVAADADPSTGANVYDCSYFGLCGFFQVGGTSLSAPLIAAVYGLAANANTVAYPAALPYQKLGTSALHDVTSGSNGSCSPAIQCTAGSGYDLPTGVGTPHGITAF